MKTRCAVNLHNVVTVSKAHLGRRVAILNSERLREICAALGFALGCTLSPKIRVLNKPGLLWLMPCTNCGPKIGESPPSCI